MPLYTTTFDLPAQVRDAVAADVDADGVMELVVSSAKDAGELPEKLTLTIYNIDRAGKAAGTKTVELGNTAALWDADNGLYLLDAEGLVVISADGVRRRIVSLSTPLAGLGAATPARADLTYDLDGDGAVELLAWSRGQACLYRQDGASLGCVASQARGAVSAGDDQGGAVLGFTSRTPPHSFADGDGDGRLDLFLPGGKTVRVSFTGERAGAREMKWSLPMDLDPPPPAPGAPRQDVAEVRFEDIDGDGIADLLINTFASSGGFFGGTSSLRFYKGGGAGFGGGQTLSVGEGAADLRLIDLDNDGDRDLVVLQADISFTNLARAMVSRAAEVELVAYTFEGGTFSTTGRSLRTLSLSLEDPRLAWSLSEDLDGDGLPDLAVEQGGEILLYRGRGDRVEPEPFVRQKLSHRAEELLVADVTGDGRAEVLAWSRGEKRATWIAWR